jgi:hypothetical protein
MVISFCKDNMDAPFATQFFFKKSNDQMFTIGLIGDAKHVLDYINVYLKWDMSGMVSMAHIKIQILPSFLHHAK